jgi:hypothetical protein
MDRPSGDLVFESALGIDRIAEHIQQPPQACIADGCADRPAGIMRRSTALQSRRPLKRNAAYPAGINMLLNLDDKTVWPIPFDLERVGDTGHCVGGKREINDGAADRNNFPHAPVAACTAFLVRQVLFVAGLHVVQ